MKRVSFLGTSAALALAGCGGGHALQSLPLVAARSTTESSARKKSVQLVPAKADPIPAKVLKDPLIGEARRYDGTTPPNASWMLAQGQTLQIAQYPALFGVLGTIAGGDGKKTFVLPNPGFGLAIAVRGVPMTKPASFAEAGRLPTPAESLGDGAVPASPKLVTVAPRTPEQVLLANAPAVRSAAPVPVSAERTASFAGARETLRTSARARLSAENAARLDDAVAAAVDGRTDVAGAVRATAATLSDGEIRSVLALSDATIRAFNPKWQGSAAGDDLPLDAAGVLVANSITRDQAREIARRELAAGG